jgi:hypothetical protein
VPYAWPCPHIALRCCCCCVVQTINDAQSSIKDLEVSLTDANVPLQPGELYQSAAAVDPSSLQVRNRVGGGGGAAFVGQAGRAQSVMGWRVVWPTTVMCWLGIIWQLVHITLHSPQGCKGGHGTDAGAALASCAMRQIQFSEVLTIMVA